MYQAIWLPRWIRPSGTGTSTSSKLANSPFRPLLLPCKTTHARVFPKKHSFGYSYLFVGVPVGWHGKVGSLLSVDTHCCFDGNEDKGWFHVQAGDYLERGSEELDLKGKLHAYLESQGVKSEEWTHAYLVTAPKFLGYSFNPVSFWYIYSDDLTLKYMILEVNNTFDERRIYLLKAGDDAGNGTTTSSTPNPKPPKRFTNVWTKDFHVSPFNSRKGTYSLSALNPLAQSPDIQIDNTITLKSSKHHPKLVARVFSTSAPLDPRTLNLRQTTRFITAWWWVGLVTFPRIVREAGKLFFRRKLHVWYRPEVDRQSIGRTPTAEESTLAPFITSHIQALLTHTPTPLSLTLSSPIPFSTTTTPQSTTPTTQSTTTTTTTLTSP
ncbi:hypothetical protein EJ05DRAFT_533980, partial [Pseudovirgaria hyperparasitica]